MLIILFTILDLEGWQHVMAKRQYEEVQAGPQSTNRFIQKPTIPTTVVTGATTAPAKAQPNLTGKRKLPVPAPDGDSQTAVDSTPLDVTALSDKELTNVAKSGFTGGFFGPGAIMTGIASAAIPGAALLVAAGRGVNMYNARQEIKARLTTPGLREDETYAIDPPDPGPLNYDRNPNITEAQNLRDAKNRQQLETLNQGPSGDYDDSVASTTMGDTPGSESGTY